MLAASTQRVYASDECQIDLGRHELWVRGAPVPIGGRTFELLVVLAQSAGELVTKNELMDRIWPGTIVLENTLYVHTAAIRKALGPYRKLLKTESGRGYRLLGSWTIRQHTTVTPASVIRQTPVSREASRTNFPALATGLVGRSAAMQKLRDLVSAYRVVTVTGPGGIGKTVLALEVARGVLAEFDDGGWLVELAPLSDPDLVPSIVAGVLGQNLGNEISAEALTRAVGEQKLLLVIDNCEHVIDAVANLAGVFVRSCPHTTILATSREVLQIDGEYVYRVPPLEVPASGLEEPDHILRHSAVELFVARAKALDDGFSPDAKNLPAIAAICRHLDGIPLAIEFAAARAAAFRIDQIAARLHDRFALLTSGRRGAVPRHQTLRATFDWSYQLLPEPERRLLRHLAVFAGGFSLDAAAAVVDDPDGAKTRVANGISSLVYKSLVNLDRSASTTRWNLLETVRAYAIEKLDQNSERQQIARRHADYYRQLFEQDEASARPTSEWPADYAREIDNLRAALNWAFSDAGVVRLGVKLASEAVDFWLSTSLLAECGNWCAKALAHLGVDAGTRDEMRLQCGLGISLIRTKGMTPEAEAALTKAVALSEEFMDFNYQLRAIFGLWLFSLRAAKLRECLELAGKYEVIAKGFGNPAASATADRMLGQSRYFLGEYAGAAACLQRARTWYPMTLRSDVPVRFDADTHVVNLCYEAATLWSLGFVDRAIRAREDALKEARNINHPVSLCLALASPSSVILVKVGDLESGEHCINELIDCSDKHSLIPYYAFGLCAKGSLTAARGDIVSADRFLRNGLQRMREIGYHLYHAYFLAEWAMVLASSGRLDEGIAEIDAAQCCAEKSQSLWCLAEVLRIKGEIFLKRDPTDLRVIEDLFKRAQTLAHNQKGLSWELRAAISLARLLRDQRRSADALAILRPVYDRFTEGFDTADLKTAKAFLDALPT